MFPIPRLAWLLLAMGFCLVGVPHFLMQQPSSKGYGPEQADAAPNINEPLNSSSDTGQSPGNSRIQFHEESARQGLTTVSPSSPPRRYVLDTMAGGGIALFDCDNDGKLDIVVV